MVTDWQFSATTTDIFIETLDVRVEVPNFEREKKIVLGKVYGQGVIRVMQMDEPLLSPSGRAGLKKRTPMLKNINSRKSTSLDAKSTWYVCVLWHHPSETIMVKQMMGRSGDHVQ